MIKEYCDICGRDIGEHESDIYGSEIVKIEIRSNLSNAKIETLMCDRCKNTLVYMMANPILIKDSARNMKLGNRIRFLFKRKLKWSDSNENQ